MIDLSHLAKAYSRVWINPHATTTIAGMLLHSWYPVDNGLYRVAPHCFSRRTNKFDAKGYDDSDDDHDDYQKYYDRDAVWRIRFYFWDDRETFRRDIDNFEDRKALRNSNGHLITSFNRDSVRPGQFELVDVIGDPDVIKHDLTLLRLYV